MSQKGFSFLHFDALIAILIVEGREVVFRKARDELYHVVGSEENAESKKHSQKANKRFLVPSFVFQAKP